MNQIIRKEKNDIMEKVVAAGDLAKLSPEETVKYYFLVCESVGLNPYTRPFDLITLNGKLTLYTTKTATDQLRQIHKVSLGISDRRKEGEVYIVTAKATMPDGKCDESTGAVTIANLKGDQLANAYMKAETKAKRRVTLSIVGLGWLDESEADSIPGAQKHTIDIPQEAPDTTPKLDPPVVINEVNGQIKAIGQKIAALRTSLGLSSDDLRSEVHKMFGTDDFKKLTMTQLDGIVAMLENQKKIVDEGFNKVFQELPGSPDSEFDDFK